MEYSKRLGHITDEQFQAALNTHDLGRFQQAKPVPAGLFGQNVFITTDKGEYVFRGAPHYSWQFKNEKYFADRLHESTGVPVPHPYILNENPSLFGWEYVIMPRMSGLNLSDDLAEENLPDSARSAIARAQGAMLREAQKLTNGFCGKYDLATRSIKPFESPFVDVYYGEILSLLNRAATHNDKTPPADLRWVNEVLDQSRDAISADFTPTFVMQDYKPGNMTADIVDGQWEITGLFDLMEASFGHGEADISRLFCVYVDNGRDDLARLFRQSYLQEHGDINGFAQRFPVFMLHDRSIIWEWVQRTDNVWWEKSWTFKQWIDPYLNPG